MECKTTMFIESTTQKSGLGLKLSPKGYEKVTDGLIRHHSEGVREVRNICLNEALPKPLDQTQGFSYLHTHTCTQSYLLHFSRLWVLEISHMQDFVFETSEAAAYFFFEKDDTSAVYQIWHAKHFV